MQDIFVAPAPYTKVNSNYKEL